MSDKIKLVYKNKEIEKQDKKTISSKLVDNTRKPENRKLISDSAV